MEQTILCYGASGFHGDAVKLSAGLNVSNTSAWNGCSFGSLLIPRTFSLIGFPFPLFLGEAHRWDTNTSDVNSSMIQSFVVINQADDVHLLIDIDDSTTAPLIAHVGSSIGWMDSSVDMSISAIHVPPGAILRTYKRRYLLGPSTDWNGTLINLKDAWNNRIRSFEVLPTNKPLRSIQAKDSVRFYINPNFDTMTLEEEEGTAVPSMEDWPYSVSSLQPGSVSVPNGLVLIQYNETNFQGSYRVWNDSISTIAPYPSFLMRSYRVLRNADWMAMTPNSTDFITCLFSNDEPTSYFRAGDMVPRLGLLRRPCDGVVVPTGIEVQVFPQQNFSGKAAVWLSGLYVNEPLSNALSIIIKTTNEDKSSSESSSIALWLSLGGLVLVGIVAFVVMRRSRERMMKCDTKLAEPLEPSIGTIDPLQLNWADLELVRLDHDHVQRTKYLASGAYGDVWLGSFRGTTLVAIKSLNSYTTESIQRFIREIHLVSQIQTPFIVSLVGVVWTAPSDLAAVFEYMPGGDLRQHLVMTSSKPIPWVTKLAWARQVADGLFYIHSMQLIHRDLKSRNILLSSGWQEAKISDLGAATDCDVDTTRTFAVGTYRWMAPEMIAYKPYTSSVDIYSFGVVLSELETHQIPYSTMKNESDIVGQILHGNLRPSFTDKCPTWYRYLALRCMAADPTDRPTTAEILHVLLTYIRQESDR